MVDIGIDFGEADAVVAVAAETPVVLPLEGSITTPCAVACDGDEYLIGQLAIDNAVFLGAVTSITRHLGTERRFVLGAKSFGATEAAGVVLAHLKTVIEESVGEPIGSAVIATPAFFDLGANRAVLDAARLAGLDRAQVVSSPLAAVRSYAPAGLSDIVLVYHLDRRTMNASVVDCHERRILGSVGNVCLGGEDFEKRLVKYVVRQAQEQAGVELEKSKEAMQLTKNLCEKAKKELSERESTRIGLMTVVGDKPVNLNLKIKREEFENLIIDLVDGTLEKVDSAIERAQEANERFGGKEDIDAVILIGGSTYVPLVQRKLREHFNRNPVTHVDPVAAIALGAAMLADSTQTDGPPSPCEMDDRCGLRKGQS